MNHLAVHQKLTQHSKSTICLVTKSWPTLWDPMDCRPARLLCPWDFPGKKTGEFAISFSGGSSWPRDRTQVSCVSSISRQILTAVPPIKKFKEWQWLQLKKPSSISVTVTTLCFGFISQDREPSQLLWVRMHWLLFRSLRTRQATPGRDHFFSAPRYFSWWTSFLPLPRPRHAIFSWEDAVAPASVFSSLSIQHLPQAFEMQTISLPSVFYHWEALSQDDPELGFWSWSCVCSITSVMSNSVKLWTVAHQSPLSMGFFRKEYWSGLPCPPWGIFPIQGSNPCLQCFLHCRRILYHWATREAWSWSYWILILH